MGLHTHHEHDDVIKWKHFPRNWSFVRGIHRSQVNSPHKGQWRAALMFSLIYAWINGWVNNREAGDLRRYRAHYDVIVMKSKCCSDDNSIQCFVYCGHHYTKTCHSQFGLWFCAIWTSNSCLDQLGPSILMHTRVIIWSTCQHWLLCIPPCLPLNENLVGCAWNIARNIYNFSRELSIFSGHVLLKYIR